MGIREWSKTLGMHTTYIPGVKAEGQYLQSEIKVVAF